MSAILGCRSRSNTPNPIDGRSCAHSSSFMIRMAFTGSIGALSCHLLLSFCAAALSVQSWLHSTIQRFFNTTWQKEKAIASGSQPTASARMRHEQRLPCLTWSRGFICKTPRSSERLDESNKPGLCSSSHQRHSPTISILSGWQSAIWPLALWKRKQKGVLKLLHA